MPKIYRDATDSVESEVRMRTKNHKNDSKMFFQINNFKDRIFIFSNFIPDFI